VSAGSRRINALVQKWFRRESFTEDGDHAGWWLLGAISCSFVALVTLVVVILSVVVSGGDTSAGRVVDTECEVRRSESEGGGTYMSCAVEIEFTAVVDGRTEMLSIRRRFSNGDDPIRLGDEYKVHYDTDAADLTASAETAHERRQSRANRIITALLFGSAAPVFWIRYRRGAWPFMNGRRAD